MFHLLQHHPHGKHGFLFVWKFIHFLEDFQSNLCGCVQCTYMDTFNNIYVLFMCIIWLFMVLIMASLLKQHKMWTNNDENWIFYAMSVHKSRKKPFFLCIITLQIFISRYHAMLCISTSFWMGSSITFFNTRISSDYFSYTYIYIFHIWTTPSMWCVCVMRDDDINKRKICVTDCMFIVYHVTRLQGENKDGIFAFFSYRDVYAATRVGILVYYTLIEFWNVTYWCVYIHTVTDTFLLKLFNWVSSSKRTVAYNFIYYVVPIKAILTWFN